MTRGDVLGHMLRAIDRITAITERTDFRAFEEDWVVQNAVMRELEILGEAAGRLSKTLTSEHSDIPWRQITGLRHKLIHDYFEVDIDVVWTTATVNVPAPSSTLRGVAFRVGCVGLRRWVTVQFLAQIATRLTRVDCGSLPLCVTRA